jgi:hypothetical protein
MACELDHENGAAKINNNRAAERAEFISPASALGK